MRVGAAVLIVAGIVVQAIIGTDNYLDIYYSGQASGLVLAGVVMFIFSFIVKERQVS